MPPAQQPPMVGTRATFLDVDGSTAATASEASLAPPVPATTPAKNVPISTFEELASRKLVMAPLPHELIARGLPTPELLAYLIFGKFGLHLPYHRMEQQCSAEGVAITRGTMCGWVEQAFSLCKLLVGGMENDARQNAQVVLTDATGVLVQDNDKCRHGHFWVYQADRDHVLFRFSAKHSSEEPKAFFKGYKGVVLSDASSVFNALFGEDEEREEANCWSHARRYFFKALDSEHRVHFWKEIPEASCSCRGVFRGLSVGSLCLGVVVDVGVGAVMVVIACRFCRGGGRPAVSVDGLGPGGCKSGRPTTPTTTPTPTPERRRPAQVGVHDHDDESAHAPRCFGTREIPFQKCTREHRDEALVGLGFCNQLFTWEQDWKKEPPARRKELRQRFSEPLLERMKAWMDQQRDRSDVVEKSRLRKALNYAENQWQGLRYFLQDGRVPSHNNDSERQLRRIAVGRKNWLFMGDEETVPWTAVFVSLLASCQLHGVEGEGYLRDLLRVLPQWPRSRLLELAPRDWKATRTRMLEEELAMPMGPLTVPAKG